MQVNDKKAEKVYILFLQIMNRKKLRIKHINIFYLLNTVVEIEALGLKRNESMTWHLNDIKNSSLHFKLDKQ
jgi:hypothetical protein